MTKTIKVSSTTVLDGVRIPAGGIAEVSDDYELVSGQSLFSRSPNRPASLPVNRPTLRPAK